MYDMLGVLKRRWKPKRASNSNRISIDSNSDCDKPRIIVPTSVRQVHPVCEEKAQILAYDKRATIEKVQQQQSYKTGGRPALDLNGGSPPPYPKRASLESNPSPTSYPLTPNICVEAGRIEFIKSNADGATNGENVATLPSPPISTTTPPPAVAPPPKIAIAAGRITVTRGLQTTDNDDAEKFDDVKEKLEARIIELEIALEAAQKTELKDKLALTKLQKQLSRREAAQRDADRERRMRADSEARAKQAVQEAARCRSRLKLLTNEFSRMEESVRSMLVYKKQADQLRQEKAALTLAFENRCQQYQSTIQRLNQEIFALRKQLEQSTLESNQGEGLLQAQREALHRHAEESRKQYERCLDDVANQVVRALLAQKGLREEIGNLNGRIHELETQNKALTSMLVHQLRGGGGGGACTGGGGESSSSTYADLDRIIAKHQLALEEDSAKVGSEADNTSADVSPINLTRTSLSTLKHCNSFNSDALDNHPATISNEKNHSPTERVVSKIEKRLSADSKLIDSGFSLEDKKRHQVLTKLWSELKGTEVTPSKLLDALSAVDSTLWVPPQRPVSLNLQLPIIQATKYRKSKPLLAQTNSKSEEETTGNESPESGNRDEGYSTMSSDVQTEGTRAGDAVVVPSSRGGLEDLKEVIDETEFADARLLVTDNKDPDILYIPFDLLNLKPRNSFPPGKDILPFQHIMRSFSDSHLCIKITTAPSPCYSFSSPISSSPSILLLDITEKSRNHLRRTKATASLIASNNATNHDQIDDHCCTSPTWTGGMNAADDRLECSTWDAEYIQHWMRLDDTRSAIQQQQQQHHRDLFELEYDRTELEDWSLSLSTEDLREQWKRAADATTPGQISLSTLPSIQENNALELEEDANECLWNNPSYLMDREGHEIVTLLMDNSTALNEKSWPYAVIDGNLNNSPDNSWSSTGSDYCHSAHEPETCSKRSSAALSGCSDDTGELPAIGTDFTRDFYRLVKFESTKSLASTSSRSLGGALSENGDREALQNVLTFIAEQQKYVQIDSRPCSLNDITKEFNIEASPPPPPQPHPHQQQRQLGDLKNCECNSISESCLLNKVNREPSNAKAWPNDDENYVTLKQLCTEYNMTNGRGNNVNNGATVGDKEEDNRKLAWRSKDEGPANARPDPVLPAIAYADEICLGTPMDSIETENCSIIGERPVDICSSINVELTSTDYQQIVLNEDDVEEEEEEAKKASSGQSGEDSNVSDTNLSSQTNAMSESLTSSISTQDTVVSKIPRRYASKIPVSPAKIIQTKINNGNNNVDAKSIKKRAQSPETSKIPKSKAYFKNTKMPKPKIMLKQTKQKAKESVIAAGAADATSVGMTSPAEQTTNVLCNIIDGPPHRAMSFHERATSKDVIDELNRMIKNGDEPAATTTTTGNPAANEGGSRLDEACRPTGWIHVEKDIDLNDPKTRANLLDVMMASVSSDSSPTSSCGGSITSDSTEEHLDYGQLHKIHRFHRQKKVHAVRPELAAVVRAPLTNHHHHHRPSIVNRPEFFLRYGDKEKEAMSSFDFLEELSTTSSSSISCSMEDAERQREFVNEQSVPD